MSKFLIWSLGKIIWLSGPPGAGKSTSGLLLARKYGYVYYEADGFMFGVNPYIPLDATEPSLATMSQPPLKVRNIPMVQISLVHESQLLMTLNCR